MENIWAQIGNFGFPMVSGHLSSGPWKKADDLTAAITSLGEVI